MKHLDLNKKRLIILLKNGQIYLCGWNDRGRDDRESQ